jgi:FAD dependent oxidoreductase
MPDSATARRPPYDVLVVGGGTAGSIAAIAAARAGASTLVVEKSGSLGGVLGLGMSFLGPADGEGYWSLGGVGRQAVRRLQELGGATDAMAEPKLGSIMAQDPELMKLVLLEMAGEAGVDLLFHSLVVGVDVDGGRVTRVRIANKGGLEDIEARMVVDCSGDADIVAQAGGGFHLGREHDRQSQPVSRIFRVGNVDVDRMFDYLEEHPEDRMGAKGEARKPYPIDFLRTTPGATLEGFAALIKRAKAAGDFDIPRSGMVVYTFPGRPEVGINVTRAHGIDGSDPDSVTRAEVETQLQMGAALRFMRKYVPGFENAYISSAPHQLGVRESRHIVGSYVLTSDDVLSGRSFDDQIGRCSYPFDIHDVATGEEVVAGQQARGGGITLYRIMRSFGIPLRCLIPNRLANVAVGGRCISADHGAASSIRGQASCMVTGHAAGVLAALAARTGRRPADVPHTEVQALLTDEGALLERTEPIASLAEPLTA